MRGIRLALGVVLVTAAVARLVAQAPSGAAPLPLIPKPATLSIDGGALQLDGCPPGASGSSAPTTISASNRG